MGENVFDSIVDGLDLVGFVIWDLDAELLLDGHDDLDGVETVEPEVCSEVGSGGDLGSILNLANS